MTQWSVEDIIQEVKHLEVILEMRKESKVKDAMVKCLVAKLQTIDSVPPSTYVKVMECFSSCSLPEEIKEQLADALEEKSADTMEGHLRLQTCPQSMINVFNYLSKTEWEKIQELTFAEACSVLVARLRKAGLKSMKEKTKKHATSFLVYLQEKQAHHLPTAGEFYKLAETVRDTFKASLQAPAVGSYNKYPLTPQELGEDWWLFSKFWLFHFKQVGGIGIGLNWIVAMPLPAPYASRSSCARSMEMTFLQGSHQKLQVQCSLLLATKGSGILTRHWSQLAVQLRCPRVPQRSTKGFARDCWPLWKALGACFWRPKRWMPATFRCCRARSCQMLPVQTACAKLTPKRSAQAQRHCQPLLQSQHWPWPMVMSLVLHQLHQRLWVRMARKSMTGNNRKTWKTMSKRLLPCWKLGRGQGWKDLVHLQRCSLSSLLPRLKARKSMRRKHQSKSHPRRTRMWRKGKDLVAYDAGATWMAAALAAKAPLLGRSSTVERSGCTTTKSRMQRGSEGSLSI